MGNLSKWSPDVIRRKIAESNKRSAQGTQDYLGGENRAIHCDYAFMPCSCNESCWCRHNFCSGHYRIKEIPFDRFLGTYISLWIPPKARENIRLAVLFGTPFNGRQAGAIQPLQWLRKNWSSVLARVRSYDECGLCDTAPRGPSSVAGLYEAKMWSQLFYDSLIPFDTESRRQIKRAGYPDPEKSYKMMNKAMFRDLRMVSEKYRLDVDAIRQLDMPEEELSQLRSSPGGQPLSRVLDKLFYMGG